MEGICDENSNEDNGREDPDNTAQFYQHFRYETIDDNKILELQSEEDICSN